MKSTSKGSRERKLQERKIQEERERQMEIPMNKFMNFVNEDGTFKYESVKIIRDNAKVGINQSAEATRFIATLLHELRWRKDQAKRHLEAYESDKKIEMLDEYGNTMDRPTCYLASLSHSINCYNSVKDIREAIINKLLPTCDGVNFTFEQCDEYILEVIKIVKDLGYDLFPEKVSLIKPN